MNRAPARPRQVGPLLAGRQRHENVRQGRVGAYRTHKATLPVGSVVYPPERNDRGQYLLWLTEAEANRLGALRRRGSCTATRSFG